MNLELRKDLAWAVLIGAVLAASPLTGAARPLVSVVLGAAAAVGVLILRRLVHRYRPEFFQARKAGPTRIEIHAPHWALFAGVLLLFVPTLVWLWEQYTFSIWRNAHGLFLPIIVAAMIRARLRALPPGDAEGAPVGLVFIAVGGILAVVDAGVRSGLVSAIGLILCAPGVALLLLGKRRTRAIAFPLALLVFILPMPERLPDPAWLTTGTSLAIERMFALVGIPTLRHQNFFILPVGMFNVSTNCGGHSFFYAAVFLGVLLASQTASKLRRAVILVATWPITVFVNGIRGSVLIGLSNKYGSQITDSFIHGLSGILTFWGVMALMMLLADWRRLLGRPVA